MWKAGNHAHGAEVRYRAVLANISEVIKNI